MIIVGIGSNLPSASGDSRQTVKDACTRLNAAPLRLVARSRLWRTKPVPESDQPWFINAVACIETSLTPALLLAYLHDLEREFGRERHELNAARSLDLDIVDYDGMVSVAAPILPHPRMIQRAFVLKPLAEICAGVGASG